VEQKTSYNRVAALLVDSSKIQAFGRSLAACLAWVAVTTTGSFLNVRIKLRCLSLGKSDSFMDELPLHHIL